MNAKPLFEGKRLPFVVEASSAAEGLPNLLETFQQKVDSLLLEHGAILFRGFAIASVEDFEKTVGVLKSRKMEYVYRSTPRTEVGRGVFSATEYPASEQIPLHNENAYQREWPLKVAFCCLKPAAQGGETPIADMRAVTAAIGTDLMNKFESLGVCYVRHYRPHIDIPWQTVFQTNDRNKVASFCASNGIEHQWLDKETLRTSQACQGVARHPILQEKFIFNQAHLFHVSSLPAEDADSLIELFGRDRLPRQATYGNGDEFPLSDLEAVRSAFQKQSVSFPWRTGDVLLLDNMQVAHGRNSYRGDRRVIASLMEPYADT